GRQAEVLAEVGRLVSQSLEPDEVGQRIVESVGPLLGSVMATLYRISLETGDFVLLASTGVGDWNRTLPRGTGAVGLALREGRPVWTPDAVTDPRITLAPRPAPRSSASSIARSSRCRSSPASGSSAPSRRSGARVASIPRTRSGSLRRS